MIATDDGDLSDEAVTVSVTDENDSPSIITGSSGSVAENASASTVIYDADASDEDTGDGVTFSVSGTDQGLVEIDPENGEVTLPAQLITRPRTLRL